MKMKDYVSIQEASKFTNIPAITIWRMIRVGHLQAEWFGQNLAIRKDDLLSFIPVYKTGEFSKAGRPRKVSKI